MENDPLGHAHDEGRSRKGRLMGKLFGRERKSSNEQKDTGDLNNFLHGPGDALPVAHAAPQMLAKLDTHAASRYPNALTVNTTSQQGMSLRQRSHSPRVRTKKGKGLVVRFVDTFPDVMGEGGDECEIPVVEIGRRKKAMVPSKARSPRLPPLRDPPRALPEVKASSQDSFTPGPLRRTQTGYSTITDASEREVSAGASSSAPSLDSSALSKDDKRKSFIELHQAEMRQAEGQAFAKAVRSVSPTQAGKEQKPSRQSPSISSVPDSPPSSAEPPSLADSPEARPRKTMEQSPASLYSTASSIHRAYSAYRQNSKLSEKETGSPSSPLKTSMNLQDVVVAAGDDALDCFVSRTRHLFELFRLHSETVRPLLASTTTDLARAALWWFLHGRMALESAVREQQQLPPPGQRANDLALEQAYANLAKSYWLSEEVLPEVTESKRNPVDADVEDARVSILSNLRKLTLSMKRNGFLPPEEALLPQAIDKAIWVEYPPVSHDIKTLLWGRWGSALASSSQGTAPAISLLESLPLGDTPQNFSFGRMTADLCLIQQGMRVHFPCLLSMLRPLSHTGLVFVITSQNGAVQLRIQSNKQAGPTWDDLRWRQETCNISIQLPRTFAVTIQLAQQDYRMLWSMYDFGSKVQSTLWHRADEQVLFRSTLKAFQYFDSDPESRQFPKEPVPDCEVALFERQLHESSPTGPRRFHRGCRIAVVTGTKTRTLCGINHAYLPQMPVRFGFLRGDQGDPALMLNFESSRSKGNMVLSFQDDKERLRFHSLLVGTALLNDEHIVAEVPLVAMTVSPSLKDTNGLATFKRLPYQRLRIINYEDGSDNPPTVRADKLRMVVEFKNGSMTDRVNVGQGEFQIRLDVHDAKTLAVLRQPQQDMTISVSESQVPADLPRELTEGLQLAREAPTCRRYQFTSLRDLHDVQAALTGFQVVFDGLAATFAISRRRMVVPIHKKWEAGLTRVQVVHQPPQTGKDAALVQLLAFFQDWPHGQSLGFVLKGTDVFEAFGRAGKAGLKIDDAKFPLPRVATEDQGPVGDDAAFVCLDLPALPGEHDDITILFDKEADRDQLVACLPAPVRNARLSRRF